MSKPLTEEEKSYFDGLRQGFEEPRRVRLVRMVLDGKDVAVVCLSVRNKFTKRYEGMMPLAILVDDDTVHRLRERDGAGPTAFSPHEVE